jgi:hypothetical protein
VPIWSFSSFSVVRRVVMNCQPNFGVLLERFFTQRLMQQHRASAHTIASFRDTFMMLRQFVQKRLRKASSTLALEDIDAPRVMGMKQAVLDKTTPPEGKPCRYRPDNPLRGFLKDL